MLLLPRYIYQRWKPPLNQCCRDHMFIGVRRDIKFRSQHCDLIGPVFTMKGTCFVLTLPRKSFSTHFYLTTFFRKTFRETHLRHGIQINKRSITQHQLILPPFGTITSLYLKESIGADFLYFYRKEFFPSLLMTVFSPRDITPDFATKSTTSPKATPALPGFPGSDCIQIRQRDGLLSRMKNAINSNTQGDQQNCRVT